MHSASLWLHYLTYVMEDPNLSGYVLVVSYAGTFIASIVSRPLAHFDKLLMSRVSFIVIAAGTALRLVTGDSSLVFMLIGESCIGLGGGLFTVYSVPLLIDCALYGYVKTGVRSDALVLSSLTFQTKIGQGLGTAIMGIWLGAAGYEELSSIQPDSAVSAIAQVHLVPYLAVAILCFVMLHFYSLQQQAPGGRPRRGRGPRERELRWDMYDILIKNAVIYDGTGADAFTGQRGREGRAHRRRGGRRAARPRMS